jgi:hypothetical protein
MRITDQYFWNFIFVIFFITLAFMGTVILKTESYIPYNELTFIDLALITLASFRLCHLIQYEKMTAFFREQLYDVVEQKGKMFLTKPTNGPRRTLIDLIVCPWSFGIWTTSIVTFLYLLITPIVFFPILFMALSSLVTIIHSFGTIVGRKAEQIKNDIEH